MNNAVNPTVGNFDREKNAAGPQNAAYLRKRAILKLAGLQMVEHENRSG